MIPSSRLSASAKRRSATRTPVVEWPSVLLITPPFTQPNTPYPATPYLTGFLAAQGVPVTQADLGLETTLRLLSRDGLERLFAAIRSRPDHARDRRPEVARALDHQQRYLDTVDAVVRFLQGRDPTLAPRIAARDLLPEGPRFAAVAGEDLDWAFGALGTGDRARHLASLYVDDLTDLVRETVAPHFGLSRYAEQLAGAAGSLDPLLDELAGPPTLIDALLDEALAPHLQARPALVGLSVPFPGNLYGALRIAQSVRRALPRTRIALGGGYANTELRDLADARLFDLADFVTLDDGERPMLCLLEHLAGRRERAGLKRTLHRHRGKVVLADGAPEADFSQSELVAPTYRGLPLDRYLSVVEVLNPMHRLWSDGRWNKLTVAHGCYWKKCTFCDVSLDYIGRYDPTPARALADRIDALVAETGGSGFHFVDEAAPPLALVDLALELLARGRSITWWGNIRFEKTFTPDVCRLLAASGCIAVTGGLEVASDRLLGLIDKGVSVAQAARVTAAFSAAGVLVHAYLMYGFPTETEAETVESLELVRQLFAAGAIDSAFWHRFVLTRHSPIAADPARFSVRVRDGRLRPFANNDLAHDDPTGCDPEPLGEGLRRALFNFMQGRGLDEDVRAWFAPELGRRKLAVPDVAPDYVAQAIADRDAEPARPDARLAWLGGPVTEGRQGKKSGLAIVGRGDEAFVPLPAPVARFVAALVAAATPSRDVDRVRHPWPRLRAVAEEFPGGAAAFARWRRGAAWAALVELGLVELP